MAIQRNRQRLGAGANDLRRVAVRLLAEDCACPGYMRFWPRMTFNEPFSLEQRLAYIPCDPSIPVFLDGYPAYLKQMLLAGLSLGKFNI